MKKIRVLFFMPDYHSSFALRNSLRDIGHSAEIYVPWSYPPDLLFSERDIIRLSKANNNLRLMFAKLPRHRLLRKLIGYAYYASEVLETIWLARKYDVIYFYGNFTTLQVPYLWTLKLLGKKMFLFPSGCKDEDSKSSWMLEDNGNVCNNCGYFDRCSDENNLTHFKITQKYMQGISGPGYRPSSELVITNFRNKAIDLDLWSPKIAVLPNSPDSKVRIMHSFASNGRDFEGKNIKGSPFVLQAVDKLITEGLPVELLYATGIPSNLMRFKQAEADIIVDQLIYGWWGSTSLEGMALGKPVVCYLNPQFEENFYRTFPEYEGNLPIVRASTSSIESVLRQLVNEPELRINYGMQSRKFAESFLNSRENAKELVDFFSNIDKSKLN